MSFRIRSIATYLPRQRLSAEDLDRQLGLPPGTCRQRYGVDSRFVAGPDESALVMGAEAARRALALAELALEDVDLLLGACGTPHQALPYNAAGVLATLGARRPIASLDVNASCLSFLAALEHCQALMATGRARRALIVSSERARVGLNGTTPETATLFGDGAAAVLLEADPSRNGLTYSCLRTYPEGYPLCQIRAGGSGLHPADRPAAEVLHASYFEMDGKALFRLVTRLAPDFLAAGLAAAGLTLAQIAHVVVHQASHTGMQHVTRRLGFAPGSVVDVFATMGNQVAASLPVALEELLVRRRTAPGERVLLFGTAAGLTLGMGVLEL